MYKLKTQNHSGLHHETGLCVFPIVHFTVVCLVTWPLSGSEAGVDLVLIKTLLLFSCHVVLMLTSLNQIVSKRGQLQPRFHLKARSLSTQL